MSLPNFLLVGAAKSGTTALYRYMKQHPQIYMSQVKEPNFFAFEGEKVDFQGPGDQKALSRRAVTDFKAYQALFQGVSGQPVLGEASPLYLYNPRAPRRIKHYLPEAKLVAILRHPADRAYSAFLMMIREDRELLVDFAQALQAEERRIHNNWEHAWHYKAMGFYGRQLTRYFENFERNQVRVYLYEDLKADSLSLLRDIFRFLGVDETFVPDMSSIPNISGKPKNQVLHALLNKRYPFKTVFKLLLPTRFRQRVTTYLNKRNLTKPPFPPEVRWQLIADYQEDIMNLQQLIQRDLSGWLV